MTPTRYYDVVVLGRSIGCLATAALLARRDFRVLILGQGSKPATYDFEGFPLRRRTFTLLAAASPVWLRILQELAQATTFKRRTRQLDPMFAVLSPERTVEIPQSPSSSPGRSSASSRKCASSWTNSTPTSPSTTPPSTLPSSAMRSGLRAPSGSASRPTGWCGTYRWCRGRPRKICSRSSLPATPTVR